jgi:hypothetical protein
MMTNIIPLVTTIVQNSTTTSNNPGQVIGVSDVVVAFIPYMLVFVAIGAMRIINMLGGMKEVWWRMRGIPYFAAWFFGPDGEPEREIFKYEIIERHSPAGFDYSGGRYFINEQGTSIAKYHGRMAWLYNWDEAEPIPYRNWKQGSGWKPELIMKAFRTVVVKDMHRLGEEVKTQGKGISILKVSVFAVLIAVGIISLYFSYNAFCGNHPLSCGGIP